jgi:prephenate dehydrogenase
MAVDEIAIDEITVDEITVDDIAVNKIMVDTMKILIIGGTGDTGQWFTRFYKKHGWDVTVWGANKRMDIAEKLGVSFADDLDKELAQSDVVMVSVPIDLTEQVIADIAPKMKQGSLLMDITSVKTMPVHAMQQYAPGGVEILGTHPMFGPTITDLQGQIVILVPVEGRSEHWLPVICSLYEGCGAGFDPFCIHFNRCRHGRTGLRRARIPQVHEPGL